MLTDLYVFCARIANPYTGMFFLLWIAIAWLWRCPLESRRGRRPRLAITVLVTVLTVYSLPATTQLLFWEFETSYPPQVSRPADADAIVVLGGGRNPLTREDCDQDDGRFELSQAALLRVWTAARMFHDGPPIPVIASGGLAPGYKGRPEAEVMADALVRLGVPREHIVLEPRSTNTSTNAYESAAILHERRLSRPILVTSVSHLWRSERFFQREGVAIHPVGCGYQTLDHRWSLASFLPSPHSVATNDHVAHELVGVTYAWLSGD